MMIHIEPQVKNVGEAPEKITNIFGLKHSFFSINISTILNSWLIIAILILIAYSVGRKLTKIPGKAQTITEFIISSFDHLCADTLGADIGRKYLPFVSTVFIFVLLSNWIGIVPVLGIEEPTRDLNTTLGLGLICAFVAHGSGIKVKGFKGYCKEYIEPGGIIGWCMLPLNIVGEFAKVGSHSIRLFGNILGGSVLILVLLELSRQLLPVYIVFQIFFGIFVGLVQAFVFAMLALAYISVKVA